MGSLSLTFYKKQSFQDYLGITNFFVCFGATYWSATDPLFLGSSFKSWGILFLVLLLVFGNFLGSSSYLYFLAALDATIFKASNSLTSIFLLLELVTF